MPAQRLILMLGILLFTAGAVLHSQRMRAGMMTLAIANGTCGEALAGPVSSYI
jgi:hypothetical protein